MPDRPGPWSPRIFPHLIEHRLALRCEVRGQLDRLTKLLPIVEPRAEREGPGQHQDPGAPSTQGAEGGHGDEQGEKIHTVRKRFFPIDHVQGQLEQQHRRQDRPETPLLLHGEDTPDPGQQ